MMSQKSKRELLEAVRPRYFRAGRKGKKLILDEFTAATGYHRKYATRLLKHGRPRRSGKRHGLPKVYQGEVVAALKQVWEVCGRICSKRLHPFVPEMVQVLERCMEMQLPAGTKGLLLRMSTASMDRCLRPIRSSYPHGLSTTKPGTLLKKAIPVRTVSPWDEDRPGFMEIDLVAHCGESVEGQFINTLTCVDVSTGWVECLAIRQRNQETVFDAIQAMQARLPFPLLGIDSDNGSEFINNMLYRYCLAQKITFTRSRPFKKNDQAHVEQKNWSVVRHLVGYDRLDSDKAYTLLQDVYKLLRFYTNFFQPVLKLVSKQHVDNKLHKRYDTAATPFQRLAASDHIASKIKIELAGTYAELNPVRLKNSIDQKVSELWKYSE